MGLKLTVSRGDKILLSNGVVIDVRTLSDRVVCLEFEAPQSVKINAIFSDSSKQFKNLQKAASLDLEVDPGQQLTVEDQRRDSLRDMSRRNRR